MSDNYEDALDAMAKKLNKEISELPIDGIFKIRMNNVISPEDKIEAERMVTFLAEALGRTDITVIVEGMNDLN